MLPGEPSQNLAGFSLSHLAFPLIEVLRQNILNCLASFELLKGPSVQFEQGASASRASRGYTATYWLRGLDSCGNGVFWGEYPKQLHGDSILLENTIYGSQQGTKVVHACGCVELLSEDNY